MKKRIIGIRGAHLLKLGIQVDVGDVTTLLLLVRDFTLSGGLALGGGPIPPSGQFLQLLVVSIDVSLVPHWKDLHH